jgi:Fur family ferric uptake transcriptional regulator
MRTSSVELIILNLLEKEHIHLTSHEVYVAIQKSLPATNPSTVYRALERLASDGKVSVSDMGTGSAVFEAVGASPHHHLVCLKCHSVLALPHSEVKVFFGSVENIHDFQISTNHLILFGTCKICQGADQTVENQ